MYTISHKIVAVIMKCLIVLTSPGCRMLAPTLGGSIFAWSIEHGKHIGFPFDVNLIFLIFSAVYFISNTLNAFVPARLDKQRKKDDVV